MSRAFTRRGYNIGALNLLQRGVDWRDPNNGHGCFKRVAGSCFHRAYPLGPPDVMFMKLTEGLQKASTYRTLASSSGPTISRRELKAWKSGSRA